MRRDGRLNGPRPDTAERLLSLLVDRRDAATAGQR